MPRSFFRLRFPGMALAVMFAVGLVGCGRAPSASSPPATKQPAATASGSPSAQAPAIVGPHLLAETWDVIYLKGNRVGFIHSQIERSLHDGRTIVTSTADTKLMLTRFGQSTDQEIAITSNESPHGRLLNFVTKAQLGPSPIICQGKVAGDRLLVETTAGGRTTQHELPWNNQIGGFMAVEQSLAQRPLEPGETRQLKLLMPMLTEVLVADVRLTARDFAKTRLLDGEFELLQVDNQTQMQGGKIESKLWVNRAGEILKTELAAMGQETFRVRREVALEDLDEQKFDLGFDSLVRITPPQKNPHAAQQIRYRITLADDDPASVFTSGGTQSIQVKDPHTIELTVTRSTPSQSNLTPAEPKPGEDDSAPNGMIQSNDPQIIELAAKAAGDETDPWKTALALEKFVHGFITSKSFGQAFATAADVAAHPEGDCTEHAVLLAALARARGIPARVATGLVYTGAPAGFGFHMWDEFYIDGHWIPLDATLARGGIGAGHIKLAHSNLKEATAMECFLPVAKVLGRLKIEVLEEK